MGSAPVLATVMLCSASWSSNQSVLAFNLRCRQTADTLVRPATGGIDRDDRDLVRLRRIRQHQGHAIVMRTHVQRILVRERNVDRSTGSGALGHRRNPRFAAAGGLAHHIAEHGGEHGVAVLLLAIDADHRGLAVTHCLIRRQQPHSNCADLAADRFAGARQRRKVFDKTPRERIVDDRDRGGLAKRRGYVAPVGSSDLVEKSEKPLDRHVGAYIGHRSPSPETIFYNYITNEAFQARFLVLASRKASPEGRCLGTSGAGGPIRGLARTRSFRIMSKSISVLMAAGLMVAGAIASGPAKAADAEIVLGAIVPSSGPFAEWGRTNTATLQMLEKQVNDAGGINGAKLRILILDDATKPAQATNNLRKLAGDDHVLAVAGPLTSSAAEVTFPVANEM